MNGYHFKVSYEKQPLQRSVVIRANASTDDDAIQIAHALADLAQFEDGSSIEIIVSGPNQRDVAKLSDALDEEEGCYLERSARIGAGYEPAAG